MTETDLVDWMDITCIDFEVLVKTFHGKSSKKIHRHGTEMESVITEKNSQEKTA